MPDCLGVQTDDCQECFFNGNLGIFVGETEICGLS